MWVPEQRKPRSLIERFGPLVAVCALIGLLCWSAYQSVGPAPLPPKRLPAEIANAKPKPPAAGDEKPGVVQEPKATEADPGADLAQNESMKTPTDAADATKGDAPLAVGGPEPEAAPVPAGAVGVVAPGEFLLLRFNTESKNWERLVTGATLRDGDRILNLPSSLSVVTIGGVRVSLVGDTELKVFAAGDASARLELLRGRLRVVAGPGKPTIALPFLSGVVTVSLPPSGVLGLERLLRRAPGSTAPAPPGLWILAAEGAIGVETEGSAATLEPSAALVFQAPKTLDAPRVLELLPPWLADPTPSAAAQEREKVLAKYLKPELSPLVGLLEAMEDENPDIRSDAIVALGAIGPLDVLVSTLRKRDDPASRRAAIAVLRNIAQRDEASAKALRQQLESDGGSKEWADNVESMLVGYSLREANDDALAIRLVNLLKHEDVGVRELAIETLQILSGRGDRLGYDPDKPTANDAVKAWTDLVQAGELRVPAAPKPR
jgi:hypothetical protein